MKKIAIIGTGLAGLTAAHFLKQRPEFEITLFEKARGVAGRMATRRAEPFAFDFGAQYFTAHSEAFKDFLEPWIQMGVVERWDPTFIELEASHQVRSIKWHDNPAHYVAAPKMTALCQHMAQELDVRLSTRVTSLQQTSTQTWALHTDTEHLGEYNFVILAVPAPQALELLPREFKYYDAVANTEMVGCYSLMLGLDSPWPFDWQAAMVHQADISWISVNNDKPRRNHKTSLVAHATNQWTQEHIDLELAEAQAHLLEQLNNVLQERLKPIHIDIHRWRYE